MTDAAATDNTTVDNVISGRFRNAPRWLIRSLLTPPSLPANTIDRSSLLEHVRGCEASGTVWLLQAPAGYGKTTSLVQIFRGLQHRSASPRWLALGRDANRPERLLRYLWHAWVREAPVRHAASEADPSAQLDDEIAELIGAVESERDTILFLDDLHVLTNPVALHVVARVAGALSSSTLFLAGRRSELSLSKLEITGRLRRIGVEELRFDAAELVRLSGGLEAERARELAQTTAGWPVAAAAVLKSSNQQDGGSLRLPRIVGRYVEEEVLAELTQEEIALLMDLSVLGRADHELLQSSAAGAHAWRTIQNAVDGGLVTATSSVASRWYECNPALGQVLRERLQRMDGDRVVHLHRLAAQWFTRQNLAPEALEHAAASRDEIYVLQTLENLEPLRLGMESGTSILRFGEHLHGLQAHDFPLVAVSQAYRAVEEGRIAEARSLLDATKEMLQLDSTNTRAAQQLSLWSRALDCALTLYEDRAVSMDEVYRLEHEITGIGTAAPALVATVAGALANICVHAGSYEEALAIGDLGMRVAGEMQAQPYSFYLRTAMCMASSGLGRMREALPHAEAALAMAPESHMPFGKAAFIGSTLRARIHLESSELEAASALMAKAFAHGLPANACPDAYALAFDVAAAVESATRGLEAAVSVISRAAEAARRLRLPRLRDFIEIIALRESTRCGNYRGSLELVNGEILQRLRAPGAAGQDTRDGQLRLLAAFEVARFQLATGHARDADATLAQIAAATANDEDAVRRFTYQVLSMTSAFQLRRYARAFEHLEKVIGIGLDCGLLRLMLIHREQILAVFDWSLRNGRSVAGKLAAFVNSTLRFANATDSASSIRRQQVKHRSSQCGFTLSPRETEILSLLAEGYSTKEVGRRLNISEGTAKTHRKNIYSKLGARTRAGVIAAARAQLLLQ
jgi:LuxR family maltose regulon positive regulatory protein